MCVVFCFVLGGLCVFVVLGAFVDLGVACNRLTFCVFEGLCAFFVILVCVIFWLGLACIKNNFCHT